MNTIDNTIKYIITNLHNSDYNLSPEQIEWIKNFLSLSPETLEVILTDINNIMKDNVIDLHDIPMIIKLITDVYHTEAKKMNISNSKNLITFVKYTLNALIDIQYINLPAAKKSIITDIINISLDLLSLNLQNNNRTCCFSLSKCF
jgi:hypothetical protein